MSDKTSSTGTPTDFTTYNDISGSQYPWSLPVINCFVGPSANFNGGKFPTEIGLSDYKLFLWIVPLFGDTYTFLEVLSVMTRLFLLMNYPRHCPSTFLWPCYIMRAYHTPTSFLLDSAILQIDIATIPLAICLPREVRWLLIQIFFAIHCNMTVPWTQPTTNTS